MAYVGVTCKASIARSGLLERRREHHAGPVKQAGHEELHLGEWHRCAAEGCESSRPYGPIRAGLRAMTAHQLRVHGCDQHHSVLESWPVVVVDNIYIVCPPCVVLIFIYQVVGSKYLFRSPVPVEQHARMECALQNAKRSKN